MRGLAAMNRVRTSLIGMGYYGCHTPPVILRNVLENPAWYTAYTPYQPEISQGRLEAILNFQTMVIELTGMDIANGSLLDEATAAAEGMAMAFRGASRQGQDFPRRPGYPPADAGGSEDPRQADRDRDSGGRYRRAVRRRIFRRPSSAIREAGRVRDIRSAIEAVQAVGGLAIVATDLLALTVIRAPGNIGADIVLDRRSVSACRFGYGGPHAAFLPAAPPTSARSRGGLSASAGQRRPHGLPSCPADPRAAYPPRKGDLEHLYRSGASGGDGRFLRPVARSRGTDADRRPCAWPCMPVCRGDARRRPQRAP